MDKPLHHTKFIKANYVFKSLVNKTMCMFWSCPFKINISLHAGIPNPKNCVGNTGCYNLFDFWRGMFELGNHDWTTLQSHLAAMMAFPFLFPSMNPVMTDITLKQKPQSISNTFTGTENPQNLIKNIIILVSKSLLWYLSKIVEWKELT